MILNFIILKQAHTNTIYNIRKKNYIVRFEMFGRIFKWVKNSKTEKWFFGNRSRPMKWTRVTLISQW